MKNEEVRSLISFYWSFSLLALTSQY